MPQDLPDYYETNLELLKIHHPAVWKTMMETRPEPVGQVYRTESGKFNLRITDSAGKTVTMHDEADPEKTGDNFLSQIPEKSTAFVGLMGFGLGYGALAIINERPHIRHLAIFELNPGIFRQALQHINLSGLLEDPRVLLSVGPDPDINTILMPARRALMLENVHTLRHLPSFAFTRQYVDLNDRLFEQFNKANVEGNTNLFHGKTYLRNRFQNMKTLHHHFLVDALYNRFAGVPAIIVAGGPSLDKNIEQLRQARDKAVIIAVDSTLPTLLAHGITPNFITTIDPQDLIFEKFAHVADSSRDVAVITMPWVSSKVAKIFPAKKIFWAFTASPIETWISKLLGSKIRTGGAATVAHLNLQAATILGCSPIVFVGQDLAYTDNKDHAANTALTHKETMDMAISTKDGLMWTDSVNGDKVATNRSFFQMKCHFEKMIQETSDSFHFINSTEGGVHINGTEVMPLMESLQRYCRQEHDITARLHPPASETPHPDPSLLLTAYRQLLKKIKALEKKIKANSRLARQVVQGLEKLEKTGNSPLTPQTLPPALQEKIITINKCHQDLDRETALWRLMQEVTLAGIQDSDRKKHLLKTLANQTEKYNEWLRESIECLEGINIVRSEVLRVFREQIEDTLAYHKQEQRLQRRLKNTNQARTKDYLKLARHYHDNGDFVLMEAALDSLPAETADAADTAESHFYRGIIAAYWTHYRQADSHFRTAMDRAPIYREKIRKFQEKLAEEYRGYGRNWIIDVKSRRRMLVKGLRYCCDYQPLVDDIRYLADEDMKILLDPARTPAHLDCADLIRTWCRDIEDNDVLRENLTSSQICAFYKQLVGQQRREGDIGGILQSYSRILEITPDDAAIHHHVADTLFGIGQFEQGIKHLHKAVAIDKTYAGYWEKIGDLLHKSGQHPEALAAYEQCYVALPENINLLKKIGDCYMAMNQPEAAKEAYQSLKTLLSEVNPAAA